MELLNHLNPSDYRKLSAIDDNWPYPFISEYTRFYKHYKNQDYYLIYDDKLDAYLPINIFKSKAFIFAQIEYAPFSEATELTADKQKDFFIRFLAFAKSTNLCTKLVQPTPSGLLAAVPDGAQFCEFGSYVTDLKNQTEEEIYGNINPKYRKAISHTGRNSARLEIGMHAIDDFYSLYENTMSRAGTYQVEKDYFINMSDYFGRERVHCAVVYDEFRPVGAVFILSTHYSAFVTHAGSFGKTKLYGSMKYLNYEMMKYLKQKGVSRYDFAGVRINNRNPALEGVFKFKKGFGGELKKGYLWKIDISPRLSKAYMLMRKLQPHKKALPDIIDQVKLESGNDLT
jgi:peptidoglycan biosynthesis/recognition FemAB-like protein